LSDVLWISLLDDTIVSSPIADIRAAVDHPLRLAEQLRAHLRALRKQRGLTQAQLGQRLGIGQVRVAEIEAQPGLVSTDQLMQVLAALGATLVLRDSGVKPEAAEPQTPAAPPRATVKRPGRSKAPGPSPAPGPPSPRSKKGSW
jgi:HTH-type transcriptional regulator/antitoxin HipB